MARVRASKGLLRPPAQNQNVSDGRRRSWIDQAKRDFVQPSAANKVIYGFLLECIWPEGHGIPGPQITEGEVRQFVDQARAAHGQPPYKDVFRRLRELQGDEGFTCITKEGTKYQLQSLEVSPKRTPREKPPAAMWRAVQESTNHKCAHCGAAAPQAKLSPDHRVPRSRNGGNEQENWQPLCEQCNILKSSACQGCTRSCFVCQWAFPETYKPIEISDDNRENIRRVAEERGVYQSDLANRILTEYFLGNN